MKKLICTFLTLTVIFIPIGAIAQLGDLPSIIFQPHSASLSSDAKAIIHSVAEKLKTNANSSIELTGYGSVDKMAQKIGFSRLDVIKHYLTEKEGISADRIALSPGMVGGDVNTVDIMDNDIAKPKVPVIEKHKAVTPTLSPATTASPMPGSKPLPKSKPVKKHKSH
jgi:hypothetical protein